MSKMYKTLKLRLICHCHFISATKTHHVSRSGIGLGEPRQSRTWCCFSDRTSKYSIFCPSLGCIQMDPRIWDMDLFASGFLVDLCIELKINHRSWNWNPKNPNFHAQSPKLEKADVGRWTNAYPTKYPREDAWCFHFQKISWLQLQSLEDEAARCERQWSPNKQQPFPACTM